MRVALDAMGGDHAPGPIVAGAIDATLEHGDLTVILVGDPSRIEAELDLNPAAPRDRLPIEAASQVVGMDEKPVEGLRRKRDNSISKAWALLAAGQAQAVVSAGNTGAMVAAGLMNAKMFLPGVRRPGIAGVFPSYRGPVVICDVGANMHPKPEDLYQYGVIGSVYASRVLGVAQPTIGVLNVGSEEDKGNELARATVSMFRKSPLAERFVGNVEGRDLYEGLARVVVCEGFTGNVLLKVGEGAVEFLFSELSKELGAVLPRLTSEDAQRVGGGLKALKSRFDYQEFGGAPLLGIRGACIICHGSSGKRAIVNALRVARLMSDEQIYSDMAEQLAAAPPAPVLDDGPSGETND